jgi:EAL domain-containing protein (putative c-di-GMP-specific phosphodiesterase class I)
MALIRDIDSSATKRTIVAAIVALASELQIQPLAEGIETHAELATVRSMNIRLCQGFLLGRPTIGSLPSIVS